VAGDPAGGVTKGRAGGVAGDAAGGGRVRRLAGHVATALAGLLVLATLSAPTGLGERTPGGFLRIPVEGLLALALVLVLPARARRVAAVLAGVGLGLLAILTLVDVGFLTVLARPFDPVSDWVLFEPAVGFLADSVGRAGATAAVLVAAGLAVALLALMTGSVLRLTRLAVRHRAAATRVLGVLGVAWVACAVLGVQVVPGVPVAAHHLDRVRQVQASLRDEAGFVAAAAADPLRDTPGDELLTALRGRDVVVAFVESYGRDAVEDPEFAPGVGAVLDAGERRLAAAGYAARSAYLTSPTAGGGSWLAHATLLSGLWVDNQRRYDHLVTTDRLTLNRAFRRAGWRTVAVMPGVTQDWPEGAFFGYDRIYAARDLGYRGPRFSYATMPDQYTLAAFQRLERAAPDRAPVMAEIPLLSSHAPWTPVPRLVDWDEVGDGAVFAPMAAAGDPPEAVLGDRGRARVQYRRSIEYSLSTLISYVETYGDDDLVLVFLGDHQPAPLVTGEDAGRDVPVTIVSRDRAVLDRISGWGWQEGLAPGARAPVWPMDAFRDRFLTAFGPRPVTGPADPPTR
jgi:hypothetical protein